jgi:hypothetical protein
MPPRAIYGVFVRCAPRRISTCNFTVLLTVNTYLLLRIASFLPVDHDQLSSRRWLQGVLFPADPQMFSPFWIEPPYKLHRLDFLHEMYRFGLNRGLRWVIFTVRTYNYEPTKESQ